MQYMTPLVRLNLVSLTLKVHAENGGLYYGKKECHLKLHQTRGGLKSRCRALVLGKIERTERNKTKRADERIVR